jgi:hypothetical protein
MQKPVLASLLSLKPVPLSGAKCSLLTAITPGKSKNSQAFRITYTGRHCLSYLPDTTLAYGILRAFNRRYGGRNAKAPNCCGVQRPAPLL